MQDVQAAVDYAGPCRQSGGDGYLLGRLAQLARSRAGEGLGRPAVPTTVAA